MGSSSASWGSKSNDSNNGWKSQQEKAWSYSDNWKSASADRWKAWETNAREPARSAPQKPAWNEPDRGTWKTTLKSERVAQQDRRGYENWRQETIRESRSPQRPPPMNRRPVNDRARVTDIPQRGRERLVKDVPRRQEDDRHGRSQPEAAPRKRDWEPEARDYMREREEAYTDRLTKRTRVDDRPSGRAAGSGVRAEPRRIKVTNIPRDLDEFDIRSAFQDQAGRVLDCQLRSGTAWISFSHASNALRAVDTFDHGELNGKVIRVELCQE